MSFFEKDYSFSNYKIKNKIKAKNKFETKNSYYFNNEEYTNENFGIMLEELEK